MSITERIRHEIREVALVTLYFLGWFLFFLTLKKLFLEEYSVEITVLGTAALGALVMAKVVVILDNTPLGDRFAENRIGLHVLWRTLVYTAVAFVVTLAERLFALYRQLGELPAALSKLWAGEDFDHFVAMNLSVGLSLLVYTAWHEVDLHIGGCGLRGVFLASRRAADPRNA